MTIPSEIWIQVFKNLDYYSLQLDCTLVCKRWLSLIRTNSDLSGELLLTDYVKDTGAINDVLKNWPGIKTLRISRKHLDFDLELCPKLEKIIFDWFNHKNLHYNCDGNLEEPQQGRFRIDRLVADVKEFKNLIKKMEATEDAWKKRRFDVRGIPLVAIKGKNIFEICMHGDNSTPLAKSYKNFENLEFVKLDGRVTYTVSKIIETLTKFKVEKTIKKLVICRNMGDDTIDTFHKELSALGELCPDLNYLHYSGSPRNDQDGAIWQLFKSLKKFPKLQHLSLTYPMEVTKDGNMEFIRENCYGLRISKLTLFHAGREPLDVLFLKNLRNIFPDLMVLELQLVNCKVICNDNDLIEILKILSTVRRLSIWHLGIICKISAEESFDMKIDKILELMKRLSKAITEVSITLTTDQDQSCAKIIKRWNSDPYLEFDPYLYSLIYIRYLFSE